VNGREEIIVREVPAIVTPVLWQRASADDTEELEARHADLTKRRATKHKECDRYIRLCAPGYITRENWTAIWQTSEPRRTI